MRPLIVLAVAVLCLVLAGCGKNFKAMPIIQGQSCPYAGVVVSLDQLVDANDPSPMDGLLIGGKKIENALDDLGENPDVR